MLRSTSSAVNRDPKPLLRWGCWLIRGCLMVLGWTTQAQVPGVDPASIDLDRRFHQEIRPFLETYCDSCHAKDKPKGDFDLRPFTSLESVIGEERRWKSVLDQVREGQMPPEEAKRHPTEELRQKLITWIREVRSFEGKRHAGDPGVVLARRLSNAEYDNSIRDLTGVELKPTREFPVDPANEAGFDNSGESLAMSPSLLKKYLEAARAVSEHLIFKPNGFGFAPYPVMAETDRDKFCVRRIVDFYQRQPTRLASYFFAAWRYQHRVELEQPQASLADVASREHVSPRYLATVWDALQSSDEVVGPFAALQILWRHLPAEVAREAEARRGCETMGQWVEQIRAQVRVKVPNLRVHGMNSGAQALVLWKDRQMAAHRRDYGGGALELRLETLGLPPENAAVEALKIPTSPDDATRSEAAYRRFCSIFPDAFYISERSRVFLETDEDRFNTGRLLSAGFHNQMGYFRDDQPLYDLILDENGRRELDALWDEFDFACQLPSRMHSGLIWFERSESEFVTGPEFEFARAEDKDIVSEAKFRRFSETYQAKARRLTSNETVLNAVADHFRLSEANIRRVETAWRQAEPLHVAALTEFAQRAYRRPLTTSEREEVGAFYRTLRNQDGVGHEEAVRDTLVSILMSPYFCYRLDLPVAREKSVPGSVQPLSDVALASRLSYFLWASMPDDELLRHAIASDLHERPVLVAQTQRLLKDPKVRGLAMEFGGNWLDFRRFEEHNAVDRGRFPAFDNALRSAMFEEPVRLFVEIATGDQSVLEFLYARHTWVNVALARHYGMPIPSGGESGWWQEPDAGRYGRGGLLPMAVFQTKNAPGLRTSPVKRGYWLVRRLLGEEIPPPPAKVPELPGDEAKLGELTLRQALEKHRADRTCAACHARFDAFGLAFEGYGPVGELRTNDLAGHPVDTHAVFPGGHEGTGVDGLRDYIKAHRQDNFLENLCRKLLAYGLGRSLQLSDDATLEAMAAAAKSDAYHFSRLVETIVTSPQFLNQRNSMELTRK